MERITRRGLFKRGMRAGIGLCGIIMASNFQWNPVQMQEVLLICAEDGQDLSLRYSASRNTLTVNGQPYELRGSYAVVAGRPQTGESVLQAYGISGNHHEISENERIIHHVPDGSGYIYNPGDGVRIIVTRVSEALFRSIEELKMIMPQSCYTHLFANG